MESKNVIEISLWRTQKKFKRNNVENAKFGRMSNASAGAVAIQSETNKIEQQQQQQQQQQKISNGKIQDWT